MALNRQQSLDSSLQISQRDQLHMTSSNEPTVLVTGATSGIGQAIARGFAASGEQVLAVGLGDLPSVEPNLSYAALDVQDIEAVRNTVAPLTRLRVVVNAAGIIRREAEHDPEVFDQVVDINFDVIFLPVRGVIDRW